MKKRKPMIVWGLWDCQWNQLRELFYTRKDALKNRECKDCKVVKFIEADRKG